MYQIFVNQKPIILTTEVEREDGFKNYLLDTVNIGKIIKDINSNAVDQVRLIGSNKDKLLKQFLKLLPNVEAGGGKVYNDKGEVLFIYRNNKWDLPKGRIDGNETFEEGAIREVEEETGVSGLKVTKQLATTYHIFKRNGKHKIKITYWFEMKTAYNGPLIPEEKEGITKVEWLKDTEIPTALENSYANIRLLIN